MNFEYKEDEIYFARLICQSGETIEKYENLFDFRPLKVKRKEFNIIRNNIYNGLVKKYGKVCFLAYNGICDTESGFAIDHVIPLSTNKLNKEIRNFKSEKGKKVKTQSFGSNHPDNLILACNKCNSFKKHKILDKDHINLIISSIKKLLKNN